MPTTADQRDLDSAEHVAREALPDQAARRQVRLFRIRHSAFPPVTVAAVS
jgi:hypothetical protein